MTHEALAADLIDTMLHSGTTTVGDKRLHATAEHTPVSETLRGAVSARMAVGSTTTT